MVGAEQVSKAGMGGAGVQGAHHTEDLGVRKHWEQRPSLLSWGSRHRGRQTER